MTTPPTPEINNCAGPLIWFDAWQCAVLECAACGYITTTGNYLDEAHRETPLLKEGLAA